MSSAKDDIRAMGPGGCGGASAIPIGVDLQRFLEGSARKPAGREAHGDVEATKAVEGLLKAWDQPAERALPCFCDCRAVPDQLAIPGAYFGSPYPEGSVPLLERSVVPGPVNSKGWFHVEHEPVEPAATPLGTLINQLVDLGIDRLDRQHARQLQQRCRWLPIDPRARAPVCGDFNSGLLGRRIVGPPEYGEFRLLMTDEPLAAPGSERPSAPQQ